ncbi:peptide-binding protein [Bacillus sp. CLL-7-23]|uniref:Peptide-binding protein n=1 Tax=Bacillus changyiensis TaxID=3004103 RepID=A0ABT4X1C7_9BACI|nr:peptide-binding protein [Bacillus changyiensis]MDA7026090.1 peptide-binding protein [Bacillus changyiensis]
MKKNKIVFSMLLIFMLLLTACNSGEVSGDKHDGKSDGKPKQGGDLVVGSTGEPTLFNPLYSTDSASSDIEDLIYSTLLDVNEKLEVEYDLAEDVKQSKDGLSFDVKLRKGVKFHDGKEMTADDVVFTYSIPLNDDYVGERGTNFKVIKSITKKGKYEVEFKLKHPDPYFYNVTLGSYGILPKHILKDVPISKLGEHEFNRKNPIGTGPFKFKEWKQGQYVKVEAFDHYYGGRPHLDSITYKIIPDGNAALTQLQAGDIGYYVIKGPDYKTAEGFDHVKVETKLGLNYSYIGWNQKNELFRDKKVRQALSYAINRQAIVDQVLDGDGKVANIPESPISWNYPKNKDKIKTFDYNPEKAKKLLKEAGWTDSDGDGILDKDGKKFAFTMKTNQGNKPREDLAVVVQQQLKEIGIEAKPQIVEWSALIEQMNPPNWDFDAIILGWSLATFPDQSNIFHSKEAKKGLNYVWYQNKELDKLLDKAKTYKDREDYQKIYEKIYEILAEDQPYTFLYYENYHRAMPANMKGFVFHPKNDLYKAEDWWLDKK